MIEVTEKSFSHNGKVVFDLNEYQYISEITIKHKGESLGNLYKFRNKQNDYFCFVDNNDKLMVYPEGVVEIHAVNTLKDNLQTKYVFLYMPTKQEITVVIDVTTFKKFIVCPYYVNNFFYVDEDLFVLENDDEYSLYYQGKVDPNFDSLGSIKFATTKEDTFSSIIECNVNDDNLLISQTRLYFTMYNIKTKQSFVNKEKIRYMIDKIGDKTVLSVFKHTDKIDVYNVDNFNVIFKNVDSFQVTGNIYSIQTEPNKPTKIYDSKDNFITEIDFEKICYVQLEKPCYAIIKRTSLFFYSEDFKKVSPELFMSIGRRARLRKANVRNRLNISNDDKFVFASYMKNLKECMLFYDGEFKIYFGNEQIFKDNLKQVSEYTFQNQIGSCFMTFETYFEYCKILFEEKKQNLEEEYGELDSNQTKYAIEHITTFILNLIRACFFTNQQKQEIIDYFKIDKSNAKTILDKDTARGLNKINNKTKNCLKRIHVTPDNLFEGSELFDIWKQ